ncbi:MAG TPA: hypothetical protein VE988_30440 [Gemmataceae bacterium]|nr:hypothetical protein [Gemmataceae bacterium]
MAESKRHIQLARDALLQRRMLGHGCFVSSADASALKEIGRSALPDIEYVILTDVLPNCPIDDQLLYQRYPGLLGLFVAFFQIAREHDPEAAVRLFQSLSGGARIAAILMLPIAWPNNLPTEIRNIIREIAEFGSGRLKEVAKWWEAKQPAGTRQQ